MDDQSRLIFRIPFWRPWVFAVACQAVLSGVVALALVGAGALRLGDSGGPLHVAALLLSWPIATGIVLLLPIGLAVRVARWHVDPDGIRGPNNWLVSHRLDWREIESVVPFPIPGYRYGQVNGGGRRWAFWVPLFLTDMGDFRAAVTRYAPPENPLRRYLEEHPA